ncbi:MAG: rhamnogalacturonan lyase [Prevotella sp.]|nr:rhamnogalacturonan lyase [Prevotella sp.]
MNKTLTLLMAAALTGTATAQAQNTPTSQMEKLTRGVVAVPASSGSGNYVSWRMLGTDDEDRMTFDVIRNSTVVKRDLYETNYQDDSAARSATYRIVTKIDGVAVDTTEAVSTWATIYKTLTLDRPATGANGGTYSPNDCSVGDVDGDGQYEIFVKWDPSNSKDNSQSGITDNVFIDCYKLDGTKLWRIDLGRNIRAGAHYTQFMVYDFDGDGKAEMICKTGPGSLDSKGNYVNSVATQDAIKAVSGTALYRSSDGRITGGQEWLTVFSGETGEAIHTTFYNPNRNMTYGGAANGSVNWGDVDGKNDSGSYGNRGERYLAAVAYLDGPDKNPSGIFSRGYYGYAFIWAVDFDGKELKQRWLSSHKTKTSYSLTTYDPDGKGTTKSFSSLKPTGTDGINSGTMFGNGNHNLSIADVDGDGCDEIIWGSAGLDNDGTLLYGTGYGHGDAIHLADHCPDRPGLEVFEVHEDKLKSAWDLHDAATGEVIFAMGPEGQDNGRGIAGQFDANVRGSLFWSSSDGSARSAVTGDVVSSNHGTTNFRVYWDGDLQEELLDGNKIDKWNGNGTSRIYINGKDLYNQGGPSSTCNSTKNTPNLQADILGDWREEIILHNDNQIAIYTTNTVTNYRVPTLMHDHTYRMGIAWQNVAYNQPPHLGYYLPDAMAPQFLNEQELTVAPNETIAWTLKWRHAKTATVSASYLPDGTRKALVVPTGLTRTINNTTKTFTLTGSLSEEGDYRIEIRMTALDGSAVIKPLTIHVGTVDTGIRSVQSVATESQQTEEQVFDLQGRQRSEMKPGEIYIIHRGAKVYKVKP